ncbi:hypothetical protein QTP70_030993 [Hemibagrus guttatus]|uniref:Mediator of RNA polymerase II transcription subunit 27 n=1 Tax=Hemibagrus guttatus TaxID=175788 RepID=A0AAE0R4I1_9TELE|nr:hypothetical protein QTP70_030993 [Hemibagrus guttatus]
MADVMNVGVNLEAFSQAINAIQALRSSVTRVFDSLKDGMKNKETLEGREKVFITEFQDNLQAVNRDLTELERLSNLVGRPSESHPLHNSGLLSLDPVQDKTPLYSQLLQAYKWSNKLQYHAGLASSLLNQQSLKRSANQIGASAKRRPKVQPSTLVLPIQYVDDVISRIGRMFPDMSIELFRPNGTSAVLLLWDRLLQYRLCFTNKIMFLAQRWGMAQGTKAHGRLLALEYRHRFLERSQKARQVLRHEDTEVAKGSELQKVTLGKVLKAIVVMRSLFIDRTIVRGYHENVYSEDGKPASFVNPINCPTSNPTSSPTSSSTGNPTNHPSSKPSSNSTNNLTCNSTSNPINYPTSKPASSSTSKPTSSSTGSFTSNPTNNPSSKPFSNPTSNPTNNYTGSSSGNPTNKPTNNLTGSSISSSTITSTSDPTRSRLANQLILVLVPIQNLLDIWSKSNYQVFQKVTDHATTALLHYQLPQMPDVVVRSFMTWLRSYIKLFQTPCQRCGKYLQDGLPPTWRDFRTLEAFHDTCRQ